MRTIWALLLSFTLVAALVHAAEPVRAARPGFPLPGLTAAEIAGYDEGFIAFRAHVFAEQGLGPTFNGGSRCYHCHRGPALGGQSKRTVTDGKSVDLYSDLLLHDIGTGDGVVQGDAQGNEFRTAPLWVVKSAAPYLHDGRARTLALAIAAHEGQALGVRDAYLALSRSDQLAIQKFLKAR